MNGFTFEKSNHSKPILTEAKQARTKKIGRPQEQEQPRDKAINCYLTETEYNKLNEKLDGRSRSTVLRNLILEYVKD